MSGNSNVVIYAFGEDTEKKNIAKSLLRLYPVISIQVINEVVNVCFRKFDLPGYEICSLLELLKAKFEIKGIDTVTVELAISIVQKYRYSYFDSLMPASSLENGCEKIYTEDMRHNQFIENKLQIINPFNPV